MTVREKIKLLTNVEVSTDNLGLLRENPEEYVKEKQDISKLKSLFYLIDAVSDMEEA